MNFKTLSIGAKTSIGTGMLVTVLVVMVWYSLRTISDFQTFDTTAAVTARKLQLAGDLNTAAATMAAGQRGVLAFTSAKRPDRAMEARDLFQRASSDFRRALDEIRPLSADDRSRQLLSQMEARLATWLPAYAELDRLATAGDLENASRVLSDRITPQFLGMGGDCAAMAELTSQTLQTDRNNAREQLSRARWSLLILVAVGAALAVGSSLMLRSATLSLRQIATEVLEGSRQIAAASGQVASAGQSLAQGTSQQAATLEETSSSTTEITAITQKNAENTRAVAGLMNETAQLVGGANRNLEEMVHSMDEIRGSSEKISKIIRVIDEIAFQTNILALNAAVEAARAGEAGMGFAVVADEVRNLAHRSAQAAKDTASLIEESIGRAGEGGRKLDQVASSIQQITGSSTQVKTLIDEIEVGSHEQSRGIEQIATAVNQMEQVTQRSAANAEQSAAASQELAAQAQRLYSIAEQLRGLVGGEAGEQVPRGGGRTGLPSGRRGAKLASTRGLDFEVDPPPVSPTAPAGRGKDRFPLNEHEGGF